MGCRYVVVGETTVTKYGCTAEIRTGGQNLAEVRTWERVKNTPLAPYFVPVLDYAPDGSWLVQQRVKPLDLSERARARAFSDMLTLAGYREQDMQPDNLGEMDGRTVLLDYGFNDAHVVGINGYRCGNCISCQGRGQVEYAPCNQ